MLPPRDGPVVTGKRGGGAAVEKQLSGRGVIEASHQIQQRTFPAPAGADERRDIAWFNAEGRVRHGLEPAVERVEVCDVDPLGHQMDSAMPSCALRRE